MLCNPRSFKTLNSGRGVKLIIIDYLITLKGEKLKYKSVAKEISKPPEVQWASKFTVFVRFTFSYKCSEPRPYLVCHVTPIENVQKLGLSGSFSKYNNTCC